ncbi:MAG: hypothetical protein Q7T93_16670 [Methylobacterium sp.]|uniref:hypothetical protein n=1 Tax=Methylobacterium sp. TaxID=409 RepID=UPI002721E555|nr:hypothetical protein [Methylobacterium sp.]MDO9428452.1 hypothetical protein [Methylobacterium sp.]
MASYPIAPVTQALTANTDTLLYTVPASGRNFGVVTVNLACSTADANVRLAYGTGASPAAGGYLIYDYPLKAAGAPLRIERDMLTPGTKVWARASAAGVSAILTGLEDGA